MDADWRRLVRSADCRVFYVHFDERDNSATLGVETREVEAYLVFTGLTGLRVTGWGHEEAGRIEVAPRDGQFADVLLGSEASGIRFRAAEVRQAERRARPAPGSP